MFGPWKSVSLSVPEFSFAENMSNVTTNEIALPVENFGSEMPSPFAPTSGLSLDLSDFGPGAGATASFQGSASGDGMSSVSVSGSAVFGAGTAGASVSAFAVGDAVDLSGFVEIDEVSIDTDDFLL